MFDRSCNNIIKMNRADSGMFLVELNYGTTLNPCIAELGENDHVYFGVMEPHKPFEKSLIKKVYSSNDLDEDGYLKVKIDPIDTEYLLPGVYYYEIKVELIDQDNLPEVHTVVKRTQFIIVE